MNKKIFSWVLVIFIIAVMVGCDLSQKPQKSASGAQQVASMYQVPRNSQGNTVEQQNILDRLRVTTDPTKILWIHLIALDGKIIRRMPVRCKVTSSGKRLEATHSASGQYTTFPDVPGTSFETDELIQPDGTFGESDSYVFWFDPQGRYHQWGTAGGLGYLLTDYPIDLRDPIDEVTGMYKVHEAALKWQKEQEALLKKQEGN